MATHRSLIKFDSAFIIDYDIKTTLFLTVVAFAKKLYIIQIIINKHIRGSETGSIVTSAKVLPS